MQTAEVLNQNFLTATGKDKARNKNLVHMKVVNRKTLNLSLPDGNLVGPGEHVIPVYEDHVAAVMAQVEPNPEAIVAAKEDFELQMARVVQEKLGTFSGTLDELRTLIRSKSNPTINEKYQTALATQPFSVEGSFQRLRGRDVKPLDSAEVIKGSEHAEPQRAQQTADQKNLVAAVVAVVQAMQQNAQPAAWIQYGDTLGILPPPESDFPITVWYLGVFVDLVDGADTFDGMVGWEEWVRWNTLIPLLTRDQYAGLIDNAVARTEQLKAEFKVKLRGDRPSVTRRRDVRSARVFPGGRSRVNFSGGGAAGGPGIFDASFDWSFT